MFTRVLLAAWSSMALVLSVPAVGADEEAAPPPAPAAPQDGRQVVDPAPDAPAGTAAGEAAGAGAEAGEKRGAEAGEQPGAEGMEGEEVDEPGEEQEDGEGETVAKPAPVEPVQVFGFEEWVEVGDVADRMRARLDTGALTSSLHVEEEETFERDGAKWVRFVISDPSKTSGKRVRISAPLVRTARIKIPGGGSEVRKVVRLSLKIGERALRAEFNLNNRDNMLCPVLIGRRALQDLGLVDAGRTDLADKKIFR